MYVHVLSIDKYWQFTPKLDLYQRILLFSDGLLSYAVNQGQDRGMDIDLTDASYDGIIRDQMLTGGLGQLADGITGDLNFRANLSRGKGKHVGMVKSSKNLGSLEGELSHGFLRAQNP